MSGNGTLGATDQPRPQADDRVALRPLAAALEAAGFYAYLSLDHEGRWMVASDSEAGRIDVRIGRDGYELDVWDVSPGLFLEEEDEHRQHALERLARVSLPGLRRGYLSPDQEVWWEEELHGVGARLHVELPFAAQPRLGEIALDRLDELNALISFVESKLLE